MVWRKQSGLFRVEQGDGKWGETFSLDDCGQILRGVELSQSAFDGCLPNAGGADEDIVSTIGDGLPGMHS